ncbi:MAG: ABC transporter substrate-binding protein [Phycisphaerales bacterium]
MHSLRVVSLVPSATEILCRIGGGELLVGRSHGCDFPPDLVRSVPIVTAPRITFESAGQVDQGRALQGQESQWTGRPARFPCVRHARAGRPAHWYQLDGPLLSRLRPDVILTQDLCGECLIDLTTVRRLADSMRPRPAVVSLHPRSVEDVLDDVLRVGEAVGLAQSAERSVVEMRQRLFDAAEYVAGFATAPSVAFLEWTDPLYVAGHCTPQLIERAGGSHPLNATRAIENSGAAAGPTGQSQRLAGTSIRIDAESLVESAPELVIVGPCRLDLSRAVESARGLMSRPWWGSLPAAERGRVLAVDGNQMFSRPGPRLVDAFEFLVSVLNDRPELWPAGFPAQWLR